MSVPPMTIRFMLACFISPNPTVVLRDATWSCEAGQETRRWLRDNDLIDADHRATERGKAWVKFICATPLPIQSWSLPPRQSTVEEGWPLGVDREHRHPNGEARTEEKGI